MLAGGFIPATLLAMWQKYRYHLTETIRLMGWRKLLTRGLVLLLVLYWLWPFGETVPDVSQQAAPPPAEPQQVAALKGEITQEDIRPLMTTRQSQYYWDSFHWMMDYGPEQTKKAFNSKVISIAYQMDAAFAGANGHTCRPYAEKLTLAGKTNLRRGVACRQAAGSWCRQPKGEKAQCRVQQGKGIGAIVDSDIHLHNFKMGWDRNLAKSPF